MSFEVLLVYDSSNVLVRGKTPCGNIHEDTQISANLKLCYLGKKDESTSDSKRNR